jgi:hypothetical protein
VQELPAIQAAATHSYGELLCAPASLELHLPAEEGDCQSALVTTRYLVTRGRGAIPQLDGQEEIDTTTTTTTYCMKSYLNSMKS